MTSTSIPRFLLPRGIAFSQGLFARTLYRQPRALPACRNASTTPQKPIVLEKPEKFNPPSHPQRLNKRPSPRSYPGPRLSESQVQEQKTKQYPNTFPPKGTWRYRFLTNRRIHVFITLGFLSFLAFTAWTQSFYHTCKFTHLLPEGRYFFVNPFDFISQWITVYKLHVEQRSAEVAAMRQRKIDDVRKRNAYREAHGIRDPQGVWSFGRRLEYYADKEDMEKHHEDTPQAEDASPVAAEPTVGKGEYVDWEGKRKPIKKWFGIW